MSSIDLIPEPWSSFLRELDEIGTAPVDFHCIGGFVITKKYGFERETSDIDVLSIVPNTQRLAFLEKGAPGSELHHKYNIYLQLVTIIEIPPDDYDTRLTEMYPRQLKHIRLLAPEAHDLALLKIERNIERDREDVKFLARKGFITAEELKQRYEKEMKPYGPSRQTEQAIDLWMNMIREELQTVVQETKVPRPASIS